MYFRSSLGTRRQNAFGREYHALELAKVTQRLGNLAEAFIVCRPLAPSTPLGKQPRFTALIDVLRTNTTLRPQWQVPLYPQVTALLSVVRSATDAQLLAPKFRVRFPNASVVRTNPTVFAENPIRRHQILTNRTETRPILEFD